MCICIYTHDLYSPQISPIPYQKDSSGVAGYKRTCVACDTSLFCSQLYYFLSPVDPLAGFSSGGYIMVVELTRRRPSPWLD